LQSILYDYTLLGFPENFRARQRDFFRNGRVADLDVVVGSYICPPEAGFRTRNHNNKQQQQAKGERAQI
jgi:hypothetical protein